LAALGRTAARKLGTALYDGLDAKFEIYQSDCGGIVEGHGLDLNNLRQPCQAPILALAVEDVVNLY
jgi:hypothetical protein